MEDPFVVDKIHPVILSGGNGSRLWPLSRDSYPKQLLQLFGDTTMLQDTAERVADPKLFGRLTVVANAEHRFAVGEQLRAVCSRAPRIILEPVARNTAAAMAVAALLAARDDPEAVLLVMPADHVLPDRVAFLAAVQDGLPLAEAGTIVLFGIRPDGPNTGYGYIRTGDVMAGRACRIDAFVEKPDRASAERYCESGSYLWNSGIFLLQARTVIRELERHEPTVLAAVDQAIAGASEDLDFLRLGATAFADAPSISFDHAVLERTTFAAVLPGDFLWSDAGTWSGLWELGDHDQHGNVAVGDIIAHDTRGSYLRSEGPLIAAVGVQDLVIVATADAVLVSHRRAAQEVKRMVETLRAAEHRAVTQTAQTYRPWGWYQCVHSGERFQVKRITVKPGHKLSLQKHFHRAEHWVVVRGTAEVEVDGRSKLVSENESVYIPIGAVHRLGNPGKVPLDLIEVQSGAYLGEDDIVRLDDIYARAEVP